MISFDGTASTVVDLRSSLQCVQGNNPRSISFMIQTTDTSGCNIILSTGTYVAYQSFAVGFSCAGTNNIIQFYSGPHYDPINGKIINDGLWHTVLVTYDGTTLSIYVDGRLDNTATSLNYGSTSSIASTLNTVGNNNYLGQLSNGIGGYWLGKLKNVLFYDYVITNSYTLANSYQTAGSVLYDSGIILLNLFSYTDYIYIYISLHNAFNTIGFIYLLILLFFIKNRFINML